MKSINPDIYEGRFDKYDCSSPCCVNCRKVMLIELLNDDHIYACSDYECQVEEGFVCDGFKCAVEKKKVSRINKWLRDYYDSPVGISNQ